MSIGCGNITDEYVFFAGKRVARRIVSSGAVNYYFTNHLGSTSVITSSAGSIVEESDYYPFGGERVVVNNDPNTYKFTGKERDTESGLDYMLARYHSSSFGRFTSPDIPFIDQHPRNPQTWNLYSYARNNPLNFTDPTGNFAQFINGQVVDSTVDGMDGAFFTGGGSESMCSEVCPQQETSAKPKKKKEKKPTAQDVANQVPPEVKKAIADSVQRSNSPTADDKEGGFHEEGGIWGTTTDGRVVPIPAKPGPYTDPTSPGATATIDPGNSVNPSLKDNLASVDGTWHVHPSGTKNNKGFAQPPSEGDKNAAHARINIVVAAREKRVYFYGKSGKPLRMSLKNFLKEPKK